MFNNALIRKFFPASNQGGNIWCVFDNTEGSSVTSWCSWLSLSMSLEKSFIISKYWLLTWESLWNPKEINIWNKVDLQSISHVSWHVIWRESEGMLLLSRFSRVRLCATPLTAAHQAPPSLGFSRQEYWSGLPFPSPMHESEKWKWSCSVVSDS